MTRSTATEFHRKALLSLLTGLFVLAGLSSGGCAIPVPRTVQLSILRLLRPAESALRRLIFALTKEMHAVAARVRGKPAGHIPRGTGNGNRVPPFKLFDPRKSFPELSQGERRRRSGPGPMISFLDGSDRRPEPKPEQPARAPDDAAQLLRRMLAMQKALENLPREARRLLRAMAKRETAPPGPKRYGPIRPGWPPGYRAEGRHEVDVLLYECGFIARYAVTRPPDTSIDLARWR